MEHRTGGRPVVTTVVRDGFDTAMAFLHERLSEADYTPEEGEVEEGDANGGGGVHLTRLTSGRRISDEPSHHSP
ncbi:hypothetical protein ACF06D_08670 [Streptomyces griseoluteus]|uniref:hypothetical protein n=1 Tax=Streptomyces griseoluteus TaxID=29306 RepID=UPI0036F51203